MKKNKESYNYSAAEAAQRRDEVVRRMANTPPQPRVTPHPTETKKKAGAGHGARKDRDDRGR